MNSLLVIQLVNNRMSKSQQLQSLIDGISHLFCRSDWITKLTHVYRESNRCADLLANHGHDQESLLVLFDVSTTNLAHFISDNSLPRFIAL